jgi:hypothetical protein
MSLIRILLSLTCASLAALRAEASPGAKSPTPPPLSATAAPHGGEQPEWAELFGDAPLPVIWQSAKASADRISAALGARKLDGVANWAETIHLAAHALVDQVQLPSAEAQQRLVAALNQAAKLADDVLDGAQHDEAPAAAAAFRRLNAALQLAQRRLPSEITSAPPAELRFAEAPAHGDHTH